MCKITSQARHCLQHQKFPPTPQKNAILSGVAGGSPQIVVTPNIICICELKPQPQSTNINNNWLIQSWPLDKL